MVRPWRGTPQRSVISWTGAPLYQSSTILLILRLRRIKQISNSSKCFHLFKGSVARWCSKSVGLLVHNFGLELSISTARPHFLHFLELSKWFNYPIKHLSIAWIDWHRLFVQIVMICYSPNFHTEICDFWQLLWFVMWPDRLLLQK